MSAPDILVPIILENEIRCGALLGKGSFCEVYGIRYIALKKRTTTDDKETPATIEARDALGRMYADHDKLDPSTRPSRLALKRLQPDLSDRRRSIALYDLQTELNLLASVKHPNIIELYASGRDEKHQSRACPPTFLVLSRIRATLEDMLQTWRNQRGLGVFVSPQTERNGWLHRLILVSRVASAVQCLHEHRIIFRDVKPENVGVDDAETPKLYDFGLAKKLPDRKGPYLLTGDTGSPRYMAPEVAMSRAYDISADIYSLGILICQVLSLQTPFQRMSAIKFKTDVVLGETRPPVHPTWPLQIQTLLPQMWHRNQGKRPTIAKVVTILENMLRGSETELFPQESRSLVHQFMKNVYPHPH